MSRLTGVSNQIQPTEVLAMWHRSIRLEELFSDVEGELAAAFQRVTAMRQKRESEASVDLARLAGGAALLGLAVAVAPNEIAALNPLEGPGVRLTAYLAAMMLLLPLSTLMFGIRSRALRCRLMWVALAGAGLGIAAILARYSSG